MENLAHAKGEDKPARFPNTVGAGLLVLNKHIREQDIFPLSENARHRIEISSSEQPTHAIGFLRETGRIHRTPVCELMMASRVNGHGATFLELYMF
jgi:hypothetical protein